MAKFYLAIDPGLSKTGLAAIDEQDRILHTELVLVSPTAKQKKILKLDKRAEVVNYKLKQIKTRLEEVILGIIKKNNITENDELIVAVEAFGYYAPTKNSRNMVNYIYETIAGVTMTKCVLLNLGLDWEEIQASQIKRTVTLFTEGKPRVKVSKEEVQDALMKMLDAKKVEKELTSYAKNHREHIADALALCQTIKHAAEYRHYIKLSAKKRAAWAAALKLDDNIVI